MADQPTTSGDLTNKRKELPEASQQRKRARASCEVNKPEDSNHENSIPRSRDCQRMEVDLLEKTNGRPTETQLRNRDANKPNQARPSWYTNPTYIAGPRKNALHGNDYQLQLLMLFALTGRNSEVDFSLATEMAEAKGFDDLVFQYTNGEGNKLYRLLQAKHRQFLSAEFKIKVSELKSNNDDNDFSLQKYFVSYLKVIQEPKFQDGELQDFIICTNTGFDFEPSTTKKDQKGTKDSKETWKGYFSEKPDVDDILNVGGKLYTFSADTSIRGGVVAELKPIFEESLTKNKLPSDGVNKMGEFLDKLVFAIGLCPSGADLERAIKEKIGGEFNLINDSIFNDFYKFMSDWMQHRIKDGDGKAHYLLHADVTQFFEEAKRKIVSLGLISSTLLYKGSIEKSGSKFKDDTQVVKKIKKFVNKKVNGERQILTIYQKSALLSGIKVRQVMADHNTKADIDIFSDLKSLSLLVGSAGNPIDAFISKVKDVLIIEHNSALDKEAKELLKSLYRGLVLKPGKRLILIIPQEQKDHTESVLDNLFRELTVDKNKKYIALEDDANNFTDLTPESQTSLLEKGKVIFQGQAVSLGDLINKDDEDMKALVDGEVLSQLINKEAIEIGIKRPDLSDLESIYYVTSVRVEEEQFSQAVNNDDLFVVSGTTKDEFSMIIAVLNIQGENAIRVFGEDNASEEDKFIILTEKDEATNLEDFKRICSKCAVTHPERAVHLIEKKGNELTWKRSYDASLYVHRELCHVVINERSLKAFIDNNPWERVEKRDIFAISGAGSKGEFYKLYYINASDEKDLYVNNVYKKNHVIILNDEEQSFKDLCNMGKLQDNYNIHWLQNKKWENNNKLVWKRSEGETSQIRELQDIESKFPIETNDFNNIANTEKVVVIAGEPGMGNSTALAHLLKQPEKSEWIIKLDLINYLQEQLRNFSGVNDLNSIIKDIFSKMDIGVTGELAERLLEYRIRHQGQVTLLFDGFDDITDESWKTDIELLKIVQNTKAKIQITTGTSLNVKDKLENALSVFSYTFEPFAEENQEEFLRKYWKASLKFISTDKTVAKAIDKGIKTLFKPFHKNVTDERYEFMSIPLLTRMFAEIYQETVVGFCSQDNEAETESLKEEVEGLSTLGLYEQFIERKYDIYFKEKTKIENNAGYAKYTLTKALDKDHQCLAFKKLFPQFAQLLDKHELPSQEQENNLKLVGIIQSTKSDSSAYFIHQTFAEYFAAGLLADMIGRRESNLTKYNSTRSLLREQIFKKENNVIRKFFDLMLAKDIEYENKYEIHNAVLNNDKNRLRVLLSDSRKAVSNVNSPDKGGRTPLHIAAAYGCLQIAVDLLHYGADVTEADGTFGWYPFMYADRSYHMDTVILILQAKDANDRHKFKDYFFLGEPIKERLPICQQIENLLSDHYKQEPTLLLIAAKEDYLVFAHFLLEHGADVNAKDDFRRTPLIWAFDTGHGKDMNPELVKLLTDRGADVNAKDTFGRTPLHIAISPNYGQGINPAILRLLIDSGADVNAQDEDGRTPLLRVINYNYVKIQMPGANVNAEDRDGRTPLLSRSYDNYPEIVKLLIEKGANVNAQDKDNTTPLLMVLSHDYGKYPEVIILLICKGANVNAQAKDGSTPLLQAINGEYMNPEIVKLLIDLGADVNAQDKDGETPLLRVIINRHATEIVNLLIDRGADVNVKYQFDMTLLLRAIMPYSGKGMNNETVKLLIESGADVNAQGKDGTTPLLQAIGPDYGCDMNPPIVKLLIKKGADVNAQCKDGTTPLLRAISPGKNIDTNPEIVKLLIDMGADVNAENEGGLTPLLMALSPSYSYEMNPAIVKLLINEGADVNAHNKYGTTPLLRCINPDDRTDTLPEIVILLIDRGADVNAQNENDMTPLLSALSPHENKDMNPDIVKLLIDTGADVNAANEDGMTPLLSALSPHENKDTNLDIVKLLIDMGADVNAANEDGMTPLLSALSPHENKDMHPDIVKLLIDTGADVNAANEDGMTPLHSALSPHENKATNPDIVKLLVERGADVYALDKSEKTPLDLAKNQGIEYLLQTYSQQREIDSTHEENAPGSVQSVERPPSAGSGSS